MTKEEMVKEIFEMSGICRREKARLVEEAFTRFMRKRKELVEQHYNAVIKSKVSACFSIAVASGIFFEESNQAEQ